MTCPGCGLRYDDMRTGLSFAEVRRMMRGRKYVRRRGVLGHWRELKLMYWSMHLGDCL